MSKAYFGLRKRHTLVNIQAEIKELLYLEVLSKCWLGKISSYDVLADYKEKKRKEAGAIPLLF
ncbi:hypothetical protein C0Q44_01325 [Paenibacillus sp. PCH8]|uniref:hypothetical protein n=1 Tax=Paenibacillus sp. PCH8 TaxID=2066524 RepID=UPI000CF99F98|nr:hypothetical protein [Paenibacillus sp. PCH8]PQP83390.1 hypothetical protein C0Q44_01325 [Paenibacillus sp. PCH8]